MLLFKIKNFKDDLIDNSYKINMNLNLLVVDEFDVRVKGTTIATIIPAITKPTAAKNAPIAPIDPKPILAKNAPIAPKNPTLVVAVPIAPAKTAGFRSLYIILK